MLSQRLRSFGLSLEETPTGVSGRAAVGFPRAALFHTLGLCKKAVESYFLTEFSKQIHNKSMTLLISLGILFLKVPLYLRTPECSNVTTDGKTCDVQSTQLGCMAAFWKKKKCSTVYRTTQKLTKVALGNPTAPLFKTPLGSLALLQAEPKSPTPINQCALGLLWVEGSVQFLSPYVQRMKQNPILLCKTK